MDEQVRLSFQVVWINSAPAGWSIPYLLGVEEAFFSNSNSSVRIRKTLAERNKKICPNLEGADVLSVTKMANLLILWRKE